MRIAEAPDWLNDLVNGRGKVCAVCGAPGPHPSLVVWQWGKTCYAYGLCGDCAGRLRTAGHDERTRLLTAAEDGVLGSDRAGVLVRRALVS